MEFLKEVALPQSLEHYRLLLFVMNMVTIVLMPYLGFLIGTAILARWYDRRGQRTGSAEDTRLAADLMGLGLHSKSVAAFAGLIPALVLVFVYAQMLQKTPSIAVGLMGYGFLALLAALVLLYSYRLTFAVGTILRSYGSLLHGRKAEPPEAGLVASYSVATARTHERSGRWGIALLSIAVFLIVGATTAAVDPSGWARYDTVFDLLLSVQFYARSALFLGVAAAATGIGVLFLAFRWEGGLAMLEETRRESLQRTGIQLSTLAVLSLPLLMLINVLLLPGAALSGGLFALVGSAVVLVFLAGIFVYAYGRDRQSRYTSYALYALLIGLTLLFTADQVAIATATRDHKVQLAALHALKTQELKTRLGVGAKALTGQEIYDAKCSACHQFDQKKVGPPYQTVLPKYQGKKDELISFILNPVKVNPEYPSMPGQGLKPAEADSIATYLLQKYQPSSPAAADTASGGGRPS